MTTTSKRTWTTKSGKKRTGWQLSYIDDKGNQVRRLFKTKGKADEERVRIEGEIAEGVHIPDRDAATVLDLAKAFLRDFEKLVKTQKRERSTLRGYRQHVDLHIAPFPIAKLKLSRLSGPECAAFARDLETTRSDDMAKRVFSTLRTILKFGITVGLCNRNPAGDMLVRSAGERSEPDADIRALIPSKQDLLTLIVTARTYDKTGRAEALVTTLMFAGLRASELRGLRWKDVSLSTEQISVRQRADRWNTIGACKSKNAYRTITIPPSTVNALKRWKVSAMPTNPDLVFPNGIGRTESYANLYRRLWVPLMTKANLTEKSPHDTGQSRKAPRPKFALQALRHVACSLWIEQGANPKQVQTWAGHSSVKFTMDRYGRLWTDLTSDRAIALAAEKSIVA